MAFSIYTELVAAEARARGIGVRHLPGMGSDYAMLDHRGHREFILQSMTDRVGTVAFRVLYNKAASAMLLADWGFPVPKSMLTDSTAKAREFIGRVGPVAVKPLTASMGKGVTVDVGSKGVEAAFAEARRFTKERGVLLQEMVSGDDHRVLVVDKKRVFGIQRVPAFVTGDGERSIADLADQWNAELSLPQHRVVLDDAAKTYLSRQGWTLDRVPPNGAQVQVREVANAHRGGFTYDCTELLCDEVIDIARRVAEAFDVGVLGIDVITDDITVSPGKIIELNPHAGIAIHHQPTFGRSRNVAGAIVDMLFPESVR